MYLIYQRATRPPLHPQEGFVIGLGTGVNAVGETWYLAQWVGDGDPALTQTHLIIGVDPDADVDIAAPWLRMNHAIKLRNEGSLRLSQLAGDYQPEERETWPIQSAEARAWLADNTASTPLLSALATARGISLEYLVGLVMENVALFEAASGAILGQQQALIVQLYAAPTLADALAVAWPEA